MTELETIAKQLGVKCSCEPAAPCFYCHAITREDALMNEIVVLKAGRSEPGLSSGSGNVTSRLQSKGLA